ncbi:MAG TPA: hypothetical protein VM580_26915 [Labilithrix sp.]|nr:hypothetical protein [Labilithrix sp.]
MNARSDKSTAVPQERFDGVALLRNMRFLGDPLADDLIDELDRAGETTVQALRRGLEDGLSTVAAPPAAVRAFLTSLESQPPWIDVTCLERGSESYLSVGHVALALGSGSLVHTSARKLSVRRGLRGACRGASRTSVGRQMRQ